MKATYLSSVLNENVRQSKTCDNHSFVHALRKYFNTNFTFNKSLGMNSSWVDQHCTSKLLIEDYSI